FIYYPINMASLVPENLPCLYDEDELKAFETLGVINGALLMSLLEESQGQEEQNDERLNSVMQSLEAEINPNIAREIDEDSQSSYVGRVDDYDRSVLSEVGFGWVDTEMPSSPRDDMNWYPDPCEDEMHGIIEFEGVRDYSQFYYGVPLEEHSYSSLWHDTYI
ncbi:hypothetical protein CFOL_v3_31531, partial [Cephalotus follicularis]